MLDAFSQMLTDTLGPMGPIIALGLVGMVLILVVLVILPRQREDPMAKLQREVTSPRASVAAVAGGGGGRLRSAPGASKKLDRFATFLEPKDEAELDTARLKMMQAGYRSKAAVRTFHAIQFGLAMLLLIVGVVLGLIRGGGEAEMHVLLLWMVGPAFLGYYAPKYWIERRRAARQQEIKRAAQAHAGEPTGRQVTSDRDQAGFRSQVSRPRFGPRER